MAGDLHSRLAAFSPTLEPCTPKAPRGLDDVHEEEVAFCVRARVLARVHVLCASAARLSHTRPPSRGSRPAWPVGEPACMVCVCGGRPDMVTVLTGRPTLPTTPRMGRRHGYVSRAGPTRLQPTSVATTFDAMPRILDGVTGHFRHRSSPGLDGGQREATIPDGCGRPSDVGGQRMVCCAYCLQLLGWHDWPVLGVLLGTRRVCGLMLGEGGISMPSEPLMHGPPRVTGPKSLCRGDTPPEAR